MLDTNKKILYIHHGGFAGGAPLSMLYTMQGMRERGYNPIVGIVRPFQELHVLYNSYGFETYELFYIPLFITWSGSEGKRLNPIMWKGVYDAYRKWKKAKILLKEFIKKQKIAFVHLNSVALSNPASMLLEEKIPFVWHIREHGPKHKGNRYRFLQNKLKEAANVIFLSKAEQESWLEGKQHGIVVHNFVDFSKFKNDSSVAQIHKNLSISPNKKILLYVGGCKLHKGIIPLLEALSYLKKERGEDFICLMPDSWIEKESANKTQQKILNLIAKYQIEEQCILMPFDPDIRALYAICDILVFPALKPHFARPIIEAAAMKKASIASDLKAIDELIIPEKTGYLIPANDSKKLANKISYLFDHEEKCLALGNAGYEFALQNFEFNQQIDKIEALYKQIEI